MKNATARPGFALLLVMILAATGVILGISYLSVASLKVRASENYRLLSRARYLAESGLEHAQYVLRFSPEQLAGTFDNPLGPFYVDDSSDSYVISCAGEASVPGRYTLTATATVGHVKRSSSVTVYRSHGPEVQVTHAMLVGSGMVWLPWGLTITGDFHANGYLLNDAQINGNATSTEGLWDPYGRISGIADGSAPVMDLPVLNIGDYTSYWVDGTQHQSIEVTQEHLTQDDPLASGGAVTPANAGGVVFVRPSLGDTITLHDDLSFTGTLVIDGNVRLDGPNIRLTAVEGFPAIIATGYIEITNAARNVIINGVVSAELGLVPGSADTALSSTTINGALASGQSGYSSSLSGTHTLNHSRRLCRLRDIASYGPDTRPRITILDWND